jgi:TolB-like protein/Tfp pilus assembly protein PilF
MATIYRFGPFRLDAAAAILFRDDEPTVLGQRAVALLGLLLERARMPVSKDALMDAAWPGLAVEDGNLTVQIAALRRVLCEVSEADSWIETLPRRGYRYVGPDVEIETSSLQANVSASLALPDRPSIAVLPFANLSGDAEQAYFADGMVDDIVTGLSRIKWLFVVARSSTAIYKGRTVDVKAVGGELGVRYVLEGSVRRVADRVRITTQLVDASSGTHVWAERYDRTFDDIFALQDEIALAVVGTIEPSLRVAEIKRVKRKRPDNLDAYDLVLQSQVDVFSGMPQQVAKALVLLDRALSLDPAYALAHAYAAMCHHCLFLRAGLSEASRSASIQHARAAITHGQDDALALTFAGFSIGMDGHDHPTAFVAVEAALALSPSSAITYNVGGVMFGWQGDGERAIEWGSRAIRLSPFDPWKWSAFHAVTLGHFNHGRYAEAADAAYKSVQLNPAHSISYMLLTASLVKLDRIEEAKSAAARVTELQPRFRYSQQFSGVNCAPALAAALGEALGVVGLPE